MGSLDCARNPALAGVGICFVPEIDRPGKPPRSQFPIGLRQVEAE
ncbi:MAG: hypothetical protein ACO331_05010 [Prochlorothrix sp.]